MDYIFLIFLLVFNFSIYLIIHKRLLLQVLCFLGCLILLILFVENFELLKSIFSFEMPKKIYFILLLLSFHLILINYLIKIIFLQIYAFVNQKIKGVLINKIKKVFVLTLLVLISVMDVIVVLKNIN